MISGKGWIVMPKANTSNRIRRIQPKKASIYISNEFKEVLEGKMMLLGWIRQDGSPDYQRLRKKLNYTNRGYFMEVMNGKMPLSIEMLLKLLVLLEMDYYIYYEDACEALGVLPSRSSATQRVGGIYHV